MKRVTAIIEKASDGGYGIYLPEIKGVVLYGYGITEDEARKNLMENLESILEFYEEENQSIPEVLNDGDSITVMIFLVSSKLILSSTYLPLPRLLV